MQLSLFDADQAKCRGKWYGPPPRRHPAFRERPGERRSTKP